ncbi:MAG: nitroreductase family protein [PVC group bacterium]|nr:nitroreductase family protein [PVC group bacterium]
MQIIKKRRSIRRYSDKPVLKEDIQAIIEAGIWAPSGLNNQPWRFKIVANKKQKDGLAQFTKYGHIIKSAPISVCIFLDKSVMYNRDKDIMAIGACIQNMLLQAYELNIGTCWLGEILNQREAVEKYLELNTDYELMAVITFGYSDKMDGQGSRKKIESFIIK